MKALGKWLWLLAFSGVFIPAVSIGAQTVFVNGAQTNQIIEGFGVNLNYQGWTNGDLKPVIDALVDQAHMNLFRVVLNNSDWEGTNDNNDPNVMNWDYYNTIYSSPRFQQLWGLIGYLNQKGVSNGICLNFQGHGPVWMGGTNLTPGLEDEWAEMIASLLYYARNTEHLQFSLVGPDNEPDNAPQGIIVTGSDQYVTMLHDLSVKLDALGMSDVRFVGPDLAFTDTSYLSALMTDPVVMAKISRFGFHSYTANATDINGVASFIAQSSYPKIPFWMTEFNVWCPQCEAGTSGDNDWTYCKGTAQYLFSYLTNGASAGLVWEGYDSIYQILGPSWSFWGLLAVNDTNAVDKTYTPRKSFYTVSQISQFVSPGSYSIGLTGNTAPLAQLMAFWQPASAGLTIAGVNTSSSAAPLSVSLASLPQVSSFDLYYTDSHSNLVHLPPVSVNKGTNFTVTIPADCVFTLVGNPIISASIIYPPDGAQFRSASTIPVLASVSTAVGSITEVDFYNGANKIDTVPIFPYDTILFNVRPGNYTLTVAATNTVGNSVVSAPVHIAVVGPLEKITVQPANVVLSPSGTQQFSAIGTDFLGTVLNPQPAFTWSTGGGVIDSNGLFTAGSVPGGPFAVTVSAQSINASAAVTILNNIAPSGTGYTWYTLSGSDQNSPRAAAPGINDGDLVTDVTLRPGGTEETSNVWEAGGIVWNDPQTLNRITYVNGSFNASDDGVFASNFTLQFSPDGFTWTNAGPEWAVAPAYTYNSAVSADVGFNFAGGLITTMGVRCIGRVRTSTHSQGSRIAYAKEVQAYRIPSPVLQTGVVDNSVVISWGASATNFLLESMADPASPYVWTTVTNTPQVIGNWQQVTLPAASGWQFFRLRQP